MSEESRAAHKPATWAGSKKPAKKTPRALAKPAEPIPDEVEILDEQTRLEDTGK